MSSGAVTSMLPFTAVSVTSQGNLAAGSLVVSRTGQNTAGSFTSTLNTTVTLQSGANLQSTLVLTDGNTTQSLRHYRNALYVTSGATDVIRVKATDVAFATPISLRLFSAAGQIVSSSLTVSSAAQSVLLESTTNSSGVVVRGTTAGEARRGPRVAPAAVQRHIVGVTLPGATLR